MVWVCLLQEKEKRSVGSGGKIGGCCPEGANTGHPVLVTPVTVVTNVALRFERGDSLLSWHPVSLVQST